MNKDFLQALIEKWPDSEQKKTLQKKLNQIKASDQEGLHDFLAMQPSGHIAIQMQNESGQYETILEQPNLIVKGSEDILFRCFAGDGEHVLYKNRIPKGGTVTIQLESESILTTGTKNNITYRSLRMNPQELWKQISKNFEDQFDVSYGYDPVILYIEHDLSSTQFVQKFKIHTIDHVTTLQTKTAETFAILMPEIYSTQTNLFMALGEGISRDQIHHSSLVKSGTWTDLAGGGYETSSSSASITFTEKVNYVKFTFGADVSGGKWKVIVNGGTPQIIDTEGAQDQVVVLNDLLNGSQNGNTTIVISPDQNATTVANPVWKLIGFEADFFEVNDNGLIQEFTNQTTKFLTPRFYSTSTVPPFQIKLPHEGIIDESVVLKKGNITFASVASIDDVTATAYHLDQEMGVITFGSIVSDVETIYEVTGQVHVHLNTSGQFYRIGNTIYNQSTHVSVLGAFATITLPFSFSLNDQDVYVRGIDSNNGDSVIFSKVTQAPSYNEEFYILSDNKIQIKFSDLQAVYEIIEILVLPKVNPGYETNYRRGILLKPKTGAEYPWYSLDDNKVTFVAEFGEFLSGVAAANQLGRMIYPVTIREMMLASGPRTEDGIQGFSNWPVKAFSLIRIPETIKDPKTGMRILWTIQLSFSQE